MYNIVIKKIVISIILLLVIAPTKIFAQSSYPYIVENFSSVINVEKDTKLTVEETILVNFIESRHGIFRIIPTVYSAKGKSIKADLNLLSVKDEKGSSYNFEVSRLRQSIKIKIGDADKYITGNNYYVITYQVEDVIQEFDNHYEIYWNVTGSEWDTVIKKVEANLTSTYANILQTECYAGAYKSTNSNCIKDFNNSTAQFESTSQLGGGKDLTLVAALSKKNNLVFPGLLEQKTKNLFDNWGYILSILPLLIIYYLWHKRGRDTRYISDNIYYKPDDTSTKTVALFRREHIPLVYHPLDGISPAEAGTIVDERVNIHDIIAEITELARLGYIKIQKFKKDKLLGKQEEYAFLKLDKAKDNKEVAKLKNYQRYLLKELFRKEVVLKSVEHVEKVFPKKKHKHDEIYNKLKGYDYVLEAGLKNHFFSSLPEFKRKLYKRMESEGFFAENPEKNKQKWIGIYIVICTIISVFVIAFVASTANFGPMIVFLTLSAIGFFFALSMPKRNPKGHSLYRQIQGLKWYLEKGKWRHEHADKNLFIADVLPLALALGVVDKITSDLSDLGVKPPEYLGGFSSNNLGTDLLGFQKSSIGSLLSSPGGSKSGGSSWSGGSGFSGGGSSGGGFGGGGGGSW